MPTEIRPSRLSDITSPPVVGQTYLVPTITDLRLPSPIPVLGPVHSDPSFAPALGPHLHYDPRFLDLSMVRVQIDGLPPEQVALVIAHRVAGVLTPEDVEIICERPMVCLREMPPFPHGHEAAPWVGDLQEAHRMCRVGQDGRCPHVGTDGRSFPRDCDGNWTCIHGLRWGADGALVPVRLPDPTLADS